MKIGAVVRLAEDPAVGGACPSFEELRAVAKRMEGTGFDSIWLADHFLYRYPDRPTVGIWECWTMLTALAAITQRVELGTLVLCSQFRNPAILAKMAATLDAVSGGRLIFGIGAGWNEPEFEAFGVPFDHRVERFEEALQIIAPLLRQGRVDFEGRFYSARNCEIAPPDPRAGGPPILIGAWGPRMLRLAARYGDIWNAGYYSTADTFAEQRAAFEAARTEVGEDAARVEVTALLKVGWADLGALPGFFEDDYLTGSAEELAAAFRGWADSGVTHVMCQYHPNTPEALGRLIEGLKAYRSAERAAPSV